MATLLQEFMALMRRHVPDIEARAELFDVFMRALEEAGDERATDPAERTTWHAPEEAPPNVTFTPGAQSERYRDQGPIASGGMGDVRRMRDRQLGRTVAIKLLQERLVDAPDACATFLSEAQATAQLQHPGIVPVYEVGRTPDRRPYFTMQEVRGRTLADVIAATHRGDADAVPPRRLVAQFHTACEAVAYAHSEGVVHRDLKPDNVMVGAFGEVKVLDWGLARVEASAEVVTARSSDAHVTQMGRIKGTPLYMSPEQARGDTAAVGPATDVYSLGVILYEILSGAPPFSGEDPLDVVLSVRRITPPPPEARLPELAELVPLCARAMDRDPARRFPNAAALAEAVAAWLDGAQRRARAQGVLQDASSHAAEAERLRRTAEICRRKASEALEGVEPWAPEVDKRAGWALEDEAERTELDAELADEASVQALQASLTHMAGLPEAHRALADRYRRQQAAAEGRRDDRAARRAELRLRTHVAALAPTDPDRLAHEDFLRGDGALTLHTEPTGAHVDLLAYRLDGRRLVPVPVRELGVTPLQGVPLGRGSWLLRLRYAGRPDVLYPVAAGRLEHWDGVPPGGVEPRPVPLPEALPPDCVYVPAGWFHAGGDAKAGAQALPAARRWADGFCARRTHVTFEEYVAYLNALRDEGRGEEAEARQPRLPGGTRVLRRVDGRFALGPDPDGDPMRPDHPAFMVDRSDAGAYAAWLAARSGVPWRLLTGLEWEKLARGVDGRLYPWGDAFDPSWCHLRPSQPGRSMACPVGIHPVDASVYGALDLAGNAETWCLDPFLPDGPPGPVVRIEDPGLDVTHLDFNCRGGSWASQPRIARGASRARRAGSLTAVFLSFRLGCRWPR